MKLYSNEKLKYLFNEVNSQDGIKEMYAAYQNQKELIGQTNLSKNGENFLSMLFDGNELEMDLSFDYPVDLEDFVLGLEDSASTTLEVGNTRRIVYTLKPNEYIPQSIECISSAPDVISVNRNGEITALKESKGNPVVITVNIDGKEKTIEVYSQLPKIKSISTSESAITIEDKGEKVVNVNISPIGADTSGLTLKSKPANVLVELNRTSSPITVKVTGQGKELQNENITIKDNNTNIENTFTVSVTVTPEPEPEPETP